MFRYACFLNYQRGNDLLYRFIRELFQSLSNELDLVTTLPVFFDTARIQAGESWPMGLNKALLQSVCMVPVLTPTYFSEQRPYCSYEYLTMEKIEAVRNRTTGRTDGLILPVVLRGAEHLPKIVIERRQYLDFSDYLAFSATQFRSRRFAELIHRLARRVAELCKVYIALDGSKNLIDLEVVLPSDQEVSEWFESIWLFRATPIFPEARYPDR